MKERPILFNGDMVRAILEGRKTQTRRIVKPANDKDWGDLCQLSPCEIAAEVNQKDDFRYSKCGLPGDQLWVRETHRCNGWATDLATIFYRANENNSYTEMCEQFPVADHKPLPVDGKWRPSIFMPRWASRIQLEITSVRVERLNDIREEDAIAEGLSIFNEDGNLYYSGIESTENSWFEKPEAWHCADPVQAFKQLWQSINGPDSWELNPWVWVIEFKLLKP